MIEYGLSIASDEHFERLTVKKAARFDFIEFPGALLDSDAACRKLDSLHRAGCPLVVRDLLDPALVHLVPGEIFQVKLEFDRKLHQRCAVASSLGADAAGAAFDVINAIEDEEYAKELIAFIKSTLGTFYEHNLTLALPGRIPFPSASADISDVIKFSKRIACPQVICAFEFHPHEPGAFETLEAHFDILRFYREFWRICFEPEHGNMLNSALLKRFAEALQLSGSLHSRVALSPGHQLPDDEMLDELLKVIGEVEDEC